MDSNPSKIKSQMITQSVRIYTTTNRVVSSKVVVNKYLTGKEVSKVFEEVKKSGISCSPYWSWGNEVIPNLGEDVTVLYFRGSPKSLKRQIILLAVKTVLSART
jgi:hypothetical protein